MTMRTTLRHRLPSALAALALQAGFFALLALSFVAVRHLPAEKEAIFYLPPPARIKPAPPPGIDGRKFTPPPTTAPPLFVPPTKPLPGLAKPPPDFAPHLSQPGAAAHAPEGLRAPAPTNAAPELLNPPAKAKDEQYWADELKKKNSPPDVPCADNNASASVGAGAPVDKACAVGIAKIPVGPPPPAPHVLIYSDRQFQAALAAANARKGVKQGQAATPPAAPQ